MAVDYICNMCRGANVTRDAWANWNTATQNWELGAVFDYAFCHHCEMETSLVERDLVPDDERSGS